MIQLVDITLKETYVRITVAGEYTQGGEFDDAISLWSTVTQLLRDNKIDSILAIWQVPGDFPMMDGFEIGSNPLELIGWERRFRLAVVHLDQRETAKEMYQFVENVSYNRGFKFRSFADEETAKAWLQNG